MQNTIRVLMLGDVVGQSGSRAIFYYVKSLKKSTKSDVVIVNGENASEGRGITPEVADHLFKSGIDVITTGNHIGQRKEVFPLLDKEQRILRPANYPHELPGRGYYILEHKDVKIGIINLQGLVNLDSLNCPFQEARELVERIRPQTKIIIIDFHAEWPEEKEALAIYLKGKISALVGTHTHVQTADERILTGGTAYITDMGMTGPRNSVIGMQKGTAIQKSLTMMPLKMEVCDEPAIINGVTIDIDVETGNALAINRIIEETSY